MSCLDVIMFLWKYSWVLRTITDNQKRTAILLVFKLIFLIAQYKLSSRRISPPVAISQTDWTVVNESNKLFEEQEETFEIIETIHFEEKAKHVESDKQNGECNKHSSEKTISEAGNTNSV